MLKARASIKTSSLSAIMAAVMTFGAIAPSPALAQMSCSDIFAREKTIIPPVVREKFNDMVRPNWNDGHYLNAIKDLQSGRKSPEDFLESRIQEEKIAVLDFMTGASWGEAGNGPRFLNDLRGAIGRAEFKRGISPELIDLIARDVYRSRIDEMTGAKAILAGRVFKGLPASMIRARLEREYFRQDLQTMTELLGLNVEGTSFQKARNRFKQFWETRYGAGNVVENAIWYGAQIATLNTLASYLPSLSRMDVMAAKKLSNDVLVELKRSGIEKTQSIYGKTMQTRAQVNATYMVSYRLFNLVTWAILFFTLGSDEDLQQAFLCWLNPLTDEERIENMSLQTESTGLQMAEAELKSLEDQKLKLQELLKTATGPGRADIEWMIGDVESRHATMAEIIGKSQKHEKLKCHLFKNESTEEAPTP